MKILVPGHDHSYVVSWVEYTQVVWNANSKTYHEYHGDEYLVEGDQVVVMPVVED